MPQSLPLVHYKLTLGHVEVPLPQTLPRIHYQENKAHNAVFLGKAQVSQVSLIWLIHESQAFLTEKSFLPRISRHSLGSNARLISSLCSILSLYFKKE